MNCPQCGEHTEQFFEGYCGWCRDQNQMELDAHNFEYDRWSGLSDAERCREISLSAQEGE